MTRIEAQQMIEVLLDDQWREAMKAVGKVIEEERRIAPHTVAQALDALEARIENLKPRG